MWDHCSRETLHDTSGKGREMRVLKEKLKYLIITACNRRYTDHYCPFWTNLLFDYPITPCAADFLFLFFSFKHWIANVIPSFKLRKICLWKYRKLNNLNWTDNPSQTISVACYLHPAKLIYLNAQPLEVVSRYRDPQPQVVENYSYVLNLRPNIYKSWCLDTFHSH